MIHSRDEVFDHRAELYNFHFWFLWWDAADRINLLGVIWALSITLHQEWCTLYLQIGRHFNFFWSANHVLPTTVLIIAIFFIALVSAVSTCDYLVCGLSEVTPIFGCCSWYWRGVWSRPGLYSSWFVQSETFIVVIQQSSAQDVTLSKANCIMPYIDDVTYSFKLHKTRSVLHTLFWPWCAQNIEVDEESRWQYSTLVYSIALKYIIAALAVLQTQLVMLLGL